MGLRGGDLVILRAVAELSLLGLTLLANGSTRNLLASRPLPKVALRLSLLREIGSEHLNRLLLPLELRV